MSFLGAEIPLVARENELRVLRRGWERALGGEAGAVLVSGDAGIGKTRLVGELVRELTAASEDPEAGSPGGGQVRVLRGHCVALGRIPPPYLPVLDVLTQLRDGLDRSGEDFADLADLVSDLLTTHGRDEHIETDQVRFFEGMRTALVSAAAHQPTLVVIEDLHWSDASTRDLLLYLLTRAGSDRLLLVLTYRSDDLTRRHPLRGWLATVARLRGVERVELPPLTPEATVTYVRSLDEDADERLVRDAAERSEGNAFFAEELLNAATAGAGGISDVLSTVLLDRIERLGPLAQKVVRAASIIGQRDIAGAALERLLQATDAAVATTDLEAALRECVQSHVLVTVGGDTYAFRHSLLREAVDADLLPGERSRLHAAYALVLGERQATGWLSAQAFHARRAGDLALALRAHVAAAAEASTMVAHGDALAHLEAALELRHAVSDADEIPDAEELTLVNRAAEAASASGRVERALAFARSAVLLADTDGDVLHRAGTRRRLARQYAVDGGWEQAERLIEEAWQLLRDEPPTVERARLLSWLSTNADDPREHRAYAEQAVREARDLGAAEAEAEALVSLAFVSLHQDQESRSLAYLEEARQRAAEGGAHESELRAWFNIGVLHHDLGRLAEATDAVDQGLARAAELGRDWSTYGAELHWLWHQLTLAQGRFSEAVERVEASLGSAHGLDRMLLLAVRATTHAVQGRWPEYDRDIAATGHTEEELVGTVLSGRMITPVAGRAVLESWTWRGRPDRIVAELAPVLAGAGEHQLIEIRLGAVLLAAIADLTRRPLRVRPDAADRPSGAPDRLQALAALAERTLQRVEQAAAQAQPRGTTLGPEGRLWLARARAEAARGRGEDDAAAWRAVVEGSAFGEPVLRALGRWRLGEALAHEAASGHEAAEALQQAHREATELGAEPLRSAIEATARRFRVSLPHSRSGGDLLTPRERSVLELVATGMTNRAVGSELYISEKTVSVHLSRVMAKLDASSRTEAVTKALSLGLIAN